MATKGGCLFGWRGTAQARIRSATTAPAPEPVSGALHRQSDNANLDKARGSQWPIEQKYGRKIS